MFTITLIIGRKLGQKLGGLGPQKKIKSQLV